MARDFLLLPGGGESPKPVGLSHLLEQLTGPSAMAPAEGGPRYFYLHGEAGAGKSALLQTLHELCRSQRIPVGRVTGSSGLSEADLLRAWAADIGFASHPFDTFNRYLRATAGGGSLPADSTINKFIKAFMEMGPAMMGLDPGWTLAAMKGLSVLSDLFPANRVIRGLLKKPAEKELERTAGLTGAFFQDLSGKAASPAILMLDNLENMAHLAPWLGLLLKLLPPQVRIVLASRFRPRGFLFPPEVSVYQIAPLSEKVARKLIATACMAKAGREPEQEVVQEIVQFARGLPLAIDVAADLWSQGRSIPLDGPRKLVEKLLWDAPDRMVPVIEAAAILRSFSQDTLEALAGQAAGEYYDELLDTYPVLPDGQTRGYRLADRWQYWIAAHLQRHEISRYQRLHAAAAEYLTRHEGHRSDLIGRAIDLPNLIDRLYHQVCADEAQGIEEFQRQAQQLTDERAEKDLEVLLRDAETWPFKLEASRLWVHHYGARLADLRREFAAAEAGYRRVINARGDVPPRLQAYALCDLGIRLASVHHAQDPGYPRPARDALERSRGLAPLDSKLVHSLMNLMHVYERDAEWEKALRLGEEAQTFLLTNTPPNYLYELASVARNVKPVYAKQGRWREMLEYQRETLSLVPQTDRYLAQRARVVTAYSAGGAWAGRLWETGRNLEHAIEDIVAKEAQIFPGAMWDLGLIQGLQGLYDRAEESLDKAEEILSAQKDKEWGMATIQAYRGRVCLRRHWRPQAVYSLRAGLEQREALQNGTLRGIPELVTWLGEALELSGDREGAEKQFRRMAFELDELGRHYYDCISRVGLARIYWDGERYTDMARVHREALALAEQHEYNDQLSILHLLTGHAAWTGSVVEWGAGQSQVLDHYKRALTYALRYNRFQLDAVLTGFYDPIPIATSVAADSPEPRTPYLPIMQACLERGAEGRRVLEALREWWYTGRNSIPGERQPSVTPLETGLSLRAAEREARRNEPGDGMPQVPVLDRLDRVLADRFPS